MQLWEPMELTGQRAPWPDHGGCHGRGGWIFPTGCFAFSRLFVFSHDFSICAVILLFKGDVPGCILGWIA